MNWWIIIFFGCAFVNLLAIELNIKFEWYRNSFLYYANIVGVLAGCYFAVYEQLLPST